MERCCSNCVNWTGTPDMEDSKCNLLGVNTRPKGCCPGCRTPETTDEEYDKAQAEADEKRKQVLAMSGPSTPAQKSVKRTVVIQARDPSKKRKRKCEPVVVRYNENRPLLTLFPHQKEAVERYAGKDMIALFFEMGCGKSLTLLSIAVDDFKKGLCEGLLVVAPNDVHKQWYDELVYGVDKDHDGVLWQEIDVDFEAQCVGGRGGQDELYPFNFEGEHLFKFVSVNVDTFSTPHKWEQIVEWANGNNYIIAIDEATVIKNRESKRSQRLLYEFNYVSRSGKTVVASTKRHPIRAVLTGTPVTNGPVDMWSIMEFVQPNYFGRSFYSFRTYYSMLCPLSALLSEEEAKKLSAAQLKASVNITQKIWQKIKETESFAEAQVLFGCDQDTYLTIKHQDHFSGAYKHMDELKEQLSKVATFRKLTDCVDMPPVSYVTREVGMSDSQIRVYNEMKRNLMAIYDDHETDAKNKLVMALRLQQIGSGFIVGKSTKFDEDYLNSDLIDSDIDNVDFSPEEVVWLDKTNPKLDALLRDVDECDKPLLILTRFSAEAAKIYELLEDKYRTGLFTGWKIVGGIEAFKEGNLDILVANSSKISRGFNLQMAHTTLFYSNTFSMETRQQAEFRTFRLGQTHPCQYIDYVSCEMDTVVCEALRMKKGLLDYLRSKPLF